MRALVVGAGFWATYQVAAWRELGVEIAGVCDLDLERARRFDVPVSTDLDSLVKEVRPDFMDVISSVEAHAEHVRAAIRLGVPVICQKPLADPFALAQSLVQEAGDLPFFVHENFRFQAPLRRVKAILESGEVGHPFRVRIQFSCSFPVFENQPALGRMSRFILTDLGSHLLDLPRFLIGEPNRLTCITRRVNQSIQGEDVATVLLNVPHREGDVSVICEMSYASRLADEAFPQTYVTIEGELGSIELRKDYLVLVTTASGTRHEQAMIPAYSWADPDYALPHASIVDCSRDLLNGLQGLPCENRASENLKTLRLVDASYRSAEMNTTIAL